MSLKGLCHEDIAVLGQSCAEVFTHTQNAPAEILNKFHQETITIIMV